MKYLLKFNEASQSAKDYIFRRDVLLDDIDDILLSLKDYLVEYTIEYIRNDLKKISINIKKLAEIRIPYLDKKSIEPILNHLFSYLKTENFELTYYYIETSQVARECDFLAMNIQTVDFDEYFKYLPDHSRELQFEFSWI